MTFGGGPLPIRGRPKRKPVGSNRINANPDFFPCFVCARLRMRERT